MLNATVVHGLLKSLTPILIIGGAIFLFKTLEATGGLAVIKAELNQVSDKPVAQLMIIGWAFPFLIEGASGFGTPAAIAAPILVGLGYPPLKVAILALIMNSVPVSFGAVGTPTWFGFSALGLSHAEHLEIGFRSALVHGIIGLFIPLLALKQLLSWQSIRRNLVFIQLSLVSTLVPYVIIARFNYEFPALVAGAIGLLSTVLLAKYQIGLAKAEKPDPADYSASDESTAATIDLTEQKTTYLIPDSSKVRLYNLSKAAFPIWGTLLFLVVSRIPDLGLKALLNSTAPLMALPLGYLGDFAVSQSLVLNLHNIFGTTESWRHNTLYVPSILPFIFISLLALLWQDKSLKGFAPVLSFTCTRMKRPTLALFGALVFVGLMMTGGNNSPVSIMGQTLAQISGNSWTLFAPFLGALGSFFSGSATISNLTFGAIQQSIALESSLDQYSVLALQSVGGALGNMVCINNIVAVCSVLGLNNSEGSILRKTALPMFIYALFAGLLGLLIL